ncbi:c923bebd-149d-41fd-9bca-196491aa9f3c [Thermothielavioides terrestris]|uniref:C923bebd-149d-41fd-9bca-196491aa9f3c n=1 Tax=Thermothielavioides terrestris TaxID=2587410 RepID=A0A446BEI9_9PEZI|nr:c923bebd-149d-41fd-9bca-196491aa9f3c [Thermothielavioides terrestris]
MLSYDVFLVLSAILALASGHAQLINIQGEPGSPASVGFKVDLALARNCTSISPCQQDATIIRDAEIEANIVNECGRTELSGNIDIGENTENALAAGQVTQVKSGTKLKVTVHQVNADGAGPFFCDLEETGNTGKFTTNLTVENNVPGVNGFSQDKTKDFVMTVVMPQSFKCIGASTGNGGCFAVQQVDTEPHVNTPQNIDTQQSLDAVLKQVQQNNKDLPAAIAANQADGLAENQRAAAIVSALLAESVVSKPAPTQTPAVDLSGGQAGGAGAASSTATAAATTATTITIGSAATQTAKTGKGASRGGKGGNNGRATADVDSIVSRNGGQVNSVNGAQGLRVLRWAKRSSGGAE